MQLATRFLLIGTLLLIGHLGPVPSCDASFLLRVTIPESDMTSYAAPQIRFGGRTEPGAVVHVNGQPVQVFPNGAFAGRIDLEVGENQLLFTARSEVGSGTAVRLVRRNAPLQTTSRQQLVIESDMMLPDQHLDLLPGDLFPVRFKGTPGGRAFFSIGDSEKTIPLIAAAPEEYDGLDGIYTGFYRIQEGDRYDKAPIRYRLTTPGLGTTQKVSYARLQVNPANWPRSALTTGSLIRLLAGPGTGRLGGADLGFLPEGVRMELTGQMDDLYRVQLTPTFHAWINRMNVNLLPKEIPPPRSLVNTVTLSRENQADQIRVPLDVRLPFLYSVQVDPPQLTLDLFGATSNLTWIHGHSEAIVIEGVEWEQPEDHRLRLILRLAEAPIWGVSADYDQTHLVVSIRSRPELSTVDAPPLQGVRIGLDPGHGGGNRGAIGSYGALEKDVMWALGQKVRAALEQAGAQVFLVRRENENIEQAERFRRALRDEADLFLSLHANSIGLSADPLQVRGTSVFFRHEFNRELAEAVYRRLLEEGLQPYGLVGSFHATVVKFTDIPSILVETAFLSHPEEEAMLLDPFDRQRIAEAIVEGLENYLRPFQKRID